jgi:hypothetical protein
VPHPTEFNIENADRAELLAALYNASRPLGLGFLHYDPTPMTTDEAREILGQADPDGAGGDYPARFARRIYFDYFKGRVMKVDLAGPVLSTHLYDRDNMPGAGYRAIKHVDGLVILQ